MVVMAMQLVQTLQAVTFVPVFTHLRGMAELVHVSIYIPRGKLIKWLRLATHYKQAGVAMCTQQTVTVMTTLQRGIFHMSAEIVVRTSQGGLEVERLIAEWPEWKGELI